MYYLFDQAICKTPANQVIRAALLPVNQHFAALLPRQFSQDECGGALGTTKYHRLCLTGAG